jgi:hypothetical protein
VSYKTYFTLNWVATDPVYHFAFKDSCAASVEYQFSNLCPTGRQPFKKDGTWFFDFVSCKDLINLTSFDDLLQLQFQLHRAISDSLSPLSHKLDSLIALVCPCPDTSRLVSMNRNDTLRGAKTFFAAKTTFGAGTTPTQDYNGIRILNTDPAVGSTMSMTQDITGTKTEVVLQAFNGGGAIGTMTDSYLLFRINGSEAMRLGWAGELILKNFRGDSTYLSTVGSDGSVGKAPISEFAKTSSLPISGGNVIGVGDSVQITVAGVSYHSIILVSYSGPRESVTSGETLLSWQITADNTVTVFGVNGRKISWMFIP